MAKAVAIVPVGHDFPPFSANKGGSIEGSKLFLLTFDLAFQIQEQLRALEFGYIIRVVLTAHDSVEVDTPKDLLRVEELLAACHA